MEIICRGCNKSIKTKCITCEHCNSNFHPNCTTFKQVHNKANKLISACRACISAANANKQKNESLIGSTAANTNKQRDESLNGSNIAPPIDPLQQILQKLTRLENLEGSMNTLSSTIDARLGEFSTAISNIEERLSSLDVLPGLVTRLSAAEEAISHVQTEQLSLRQQVAALSTAKQAPPALDASAANRLKKLENDVQNLCTLQRSVANELVITGLPTTTETSTMKGLVFAALKVLDPGFLERDIMHVRRMHSKTTTEHVPSTSTTTEHVPSTSTSDATAATVDTAVDTATADTQLSDSRTPAKTISIPLIVRLSSPDLMLNLIHAKIKMGKLHSSQLSVELLEQAKITTPLPSLLININELLPAELHRLRSLARTQAKKNGFISYVRSGRIYIKKKKEDHATIIASIEELNNFLA